MRNYKTWCYSATRNETRFGWFYLMLFELKLLRNMLLNTQSLFEEALCMFDFQYMNLMVQNSNHLLEDLKLLSDFSPDFVHPPVDFYVQ